MASETEEVKQPGFFEKNKKVIIIISVVIIAGLLLVPDIYIRKYVPWVK
jgi:hypothetical protein